MKINILINFSCFYRHRRALSFYNCKQLQKLVIIFYVLNSFLPTFVPFILLLWYDFQMLLHCFVYVHFNILGRCIDFLLMLFQLLFYFRLTEIGPWPWPWLVLSSIHYIRNYNSTHQASGLDLVSFPTQPLGMLWLNQIIYRQPIIPCYQNFLQEGYFEISPSCFSNCLSLLSLTI